MNKVRLLLMAFSLAGIAVVFYLSWLPSPDIGFQPYFPAWLGNWTNAHANVRTAVPFVFLGLAGDFVYPEQVLSPWRRRILLITMLTTIVLLAEIGQLFIPNRSFDPADIFWGILGTATGITSAIAVRRTQSST